MLLQNYKISRLQDYNPASGTGISRLERFLCFNILSV